MNNKNMNTSPKTKRKLPKSWEDLKECKYLKTEPVVTDNEQGIDSSRKYSSTTSVREAIEEGLLVPVLLA